MPARGNPNKCYYCGQVEKCTKDHFYPKSKGGKYLVWACWFCQNSKGNKMPLNWLKYINGLTILTEEAKFRINTAVTTLIEILGHFEPKKEKPNKVELIKPKPDEFDRFW